MTALEQPPEQSDSGWSLPMRLLAGMAALVVVLAGMHAASSLLELLFLALFIGVITTPAFLWLRDRGVPTYLVLLFMASLLAAMLSVAVLVVSRALGSLATQLPVYQETLRRYLVDWLEWLRSHGMDISVEEHQAVLDTTQVLGLAGSGVALVSQMFSQGFVVLLLVVFLWLEATVLPVKVRAVVSPDTWSGIHAGVVNVRRYMGMKTVMSLLTGALILAWSLLTGLDYPLLLGGLAFLLNFVPVVGSLVASLPAIALALVGAGPGWALLVAGGYLVINVGVSNVIEPRYFGRGLGISALVVLLSMLFWGWVLGPIGMFLSVPLTRAVKLVVEGHEDTRWIGLLLSGGSPQRIRQTIRMQQVQAPESDSA
ncbi:MAG: AI-2E family transporter [Planctomycetota bacterium]